MIVTRLITDEFDDDAEKLLDYFEATWIGAPKKRGTGRKKPEFPLELWNVYDRVCADLPRSNNSIEDWHHAFADRVAIAHPTITSWLTRSDANNLSLKSKLRKFVKATNRSRRKRCIESSTKDSSVWLMITPMWVWENI